MTVKYLESVIENVKVPNNLFKWITARDLLNLKFTGNNHTIDLTARDQIAFRTEISPSIFWLTETFAMKLSFNTPTLNSWAASSDLANYLNYLNGTMTFSNWTTKHKTGKIIDSLQNLNITQTGVTSLDTENAPAENGLAETSLVSCFPLDNIVCAMASYKSVNKPGPERKVTEPGFHSVYFMLKEPYNCLLWVVQKSSHGCQTNQILTTFNSTLSLYDSLTYYDMAQRTGINIICDDKYESVQNIKANVIPKWKYYSDTEIVSPVRVEDELSLESQYDDLSTSKRIYHYTTLPGPDSKSYDGHFLISKRIASLSFITTGGAVVCKLNDALKFVRRHTTTGKLCSVFQYKVTLDQTYFISAPLLQLRVWFPTKHVCDSVSKIHLTQATKTVSFASLNEIYCHRKTKPYVVAYCFNQPDARTFGSNFVPNILSNIEVQTDESKTVLRFRDNSTVAQILHQEPEGDGGRQFIRTKEPMVVGEIIDNVLVGLSYKADNGFEPVRAGVNNSKDKLGFTLSLTNQLADDKAESMLKTEAKCRISFQQIFSVVVSVALIFLVCMCFLK